MGGAGNLSIASIIGIGGQSLMKEGNGTLTLSGKNTYTAETYVSGGKLVYGADDVIATGNVIVNGGTLDLGAYSDTVGSVTVSGGGNITGSGILTTTGNYEMQSGTVSAILAGSKPLYKTTAGTAYLTATNTYTGNTMLRVGTLSVATLANSGGNSSIGASSNAASSLVFEGNATLQYTGGNTTSDRAFTINAGKVATIETASNLSLAGATGNATTGALAKTGAGTLTLTGNNTYTGATTVNAGTLQLAKAGSLYNGNTSAWTAANLNVASGATAAFNVGGTGEFTSGNLDSLVALGNSTGGFQSGSSIGLDTSSGNFSYASGIANSNGGSNLLGLTKLGNNTLTLTGSNSYTGGTTVSAGTLAGTSASIQGAVVNNAAVEFNQAANGTYAGAMSGTGSLSKTDVGTPTLSGSNSYTGGTTVAGGSLIVNGSLASTALTVLTGALLGGSGSIGSGGALVAIESGGSLSPGNSPGMLTVNGSLTLLLGSSYDYQLISGSALADSVDVNGVLSLGDTTLSLTNQGTYVANEKFTLFAYESLTGTFNGLADDTTFTAGGGDWLINYNDTAGGLNTEAVGTSYVTITAVPEPSALALLGLGTLGLALRRRR